MALRALLEGDRARSLAAVDQMRTDSTRDPEGFYFVGRYLAKLGEPDRACDALASAVRSGFNTSRAMAWDPWLDALRGLPAFDAVSKDADAAYRAAVAAFEAAGGVDVLGAGSAR